MAVSAEYLDDPTMHTPANVLIVPQPGAERYPLLENGMTPDSLAAQLRQDFSHRPDVVVGVEGPSVQLRYRAHSSAVGLETDLDIVTGKLPPVYTREQEVVVTIGRHGVEQVAQYDVSPAGADGVPLPTTVASYIPEVDDTGVSLHVDGSGRHYVRTRARQQTIAPTGAPGSAPAALAEDSQAQAPAQTTQNVLGIINGLFPTGRARDGRPVLERARELQAAGAAGVEVGTPDAQGRVAVLSAIALGGALYTYKFVVDTNTGRTLYYYHGGNTLHANPEARRAEDEQEAPAASVFEFDADGRVTRRRTQGLEISAITGTLQPFDDISDFTYTEIPLTGGGAYEIASLRREIHADGQTIRTAFEAEPDLVEAVDVDPTRVYAIQFQRVSEMRDPAKAGQPKEVGEVFERAFTTGSQPTERLVLTLRVAMRDGALVCERVGAVVEQLPQQP